MTDIPTAPRTDDRPLRHAWAWVLAYGLMNLLAWRLGWPMWVI